ncbi:MAG: hypothetical protein BZY83_04900 [SAR202 cluster bacterium Casp-Chloro-G2]|nr:MAG: hypothetical protein BZY83_04900 [SAR202 cluster bacterium Casp-Chloro-G2]
MLGCPSNIPVSFCPILMVPAGEVFTGVVLVASGFDVGVSPDVAVAVDSGLPVDDTGVAVAEEPQATSRAANNRTKA